MIVKEARIKELVYGKLANHMEPVFAAAGFKYQKSKRRFVRVQNKLEQVLSFYHTSPAFYYNDNTEKLYLLLYISARVETPAFDKWYSGLTNEVSHLFINLKNHHYPCRFELDFEDLLGNDFYAPTASQRFKGHMRGYFASEETTETSFIPVEELLEQRFPEMLKSFEENKDVSRLYENRDYPMMLLYKFMLFFEGHKELAKIELDDQYRFLTEGVTNNLKENNTEEARGFMQGIEQFIRLCRLTGAGEYENPLAVSFPKKENRNARFDFSDKVSYTETLRLGISSFKHYGVLVNSKQEILIWSDNKRLIKLDADGTIVLDYEITVPPGYSNLSWAKSGLIEETDEFYFNNLLIRADHTVLDLPLPVDTDKKNKKPKSYHIYHLAYSAAKEQYYIYFKGFFITYNKSGEKLSSIVMPNSSETRILPDKEWIITQSGDNENHILDFNGNVLYKFEYGGGNRFYDISADYQYLACFNYSTKSQLYRIPDGKKFTLWAHPTHLKGYVETFYNDINHNFGMSVAAFSPDNSYLVGGGDHGKYVAWKLPKSERVELIPSPNCISIMQPDTNRIILGNNGSVVEYKELQPGVYKLENQTFFVNRGNDICAIRFLDNGDLFLTILSGSTFVLSWDRNFKNLSHYKTEGQIELHGKKYLTTRSQDELVIYKRK